MIIDLIKKLFGNFSIEFKEIFDEILFLFVNLFYLMFNVVKVVKFGYMFIKNV